MNKSSTQWSTQNALGRPAIDYWNELLCEKVIGLDIDSDRTNDFQGHLAARSLGSVESFLISAGDVQTVALAKHGYPLRGADDSFILIHMRRGWLDLRTPQGESRVGVGDTVLLSAAESFEFKSPAGTSSLVLRFSSEALFRELPFVESCLGRRINGDLNWGNTLSSALWNIRPQDISDSQHNPDDVARQITGLLRLAYDCADDSTSRSQRKLMQRIDEALMARFMETALTPAELAADAGISKRYLHELFAKQGTTFNKTLFLKRIEHACRLLADPRNRRRSITEIAFICGFANSSHFSRVFRAQAGMSPREYRTARLGV